MTPELTGEAWAQIRADYEHTDRPVEDICAEHGISSGTLRDRVRRWRWTKRRTPIPLEGPPPAPRTGTAVPSGRAFAAAAPWPAAALPVETARLHPVAVPQAESGGEPGMPAWAPGLVPDLAPHLDPDPASDVAPDPADDEAIVPRLQGALARVLPAIEATVATLAARPAHPRELERAARALASLTRTLRELHSLLNQHQAAAAAADSDDPVPEDIDEFRNQLARRISAFIDAQHREKLGCAGPQEV